MGFNIRALLRQPLHTDDLRLLAEDGQRIVKMLHSKTASFNREIERNNREETE